MSHMDEYYWQKRWDEGQTGWDIGAPSPALTKYFDSLENKNIKILIPGCGNAYEAEYLFKNGFENTYVVDISDLAIKSFLNRFPKFPSQNAFHGDFFEQRGAFDLIVEQTFFCALDPTQRPAYAKKMHGLLADKGRLMGLLFDIPLFADHPPYGGNAQEYQSYFAPYFNFLRFEKATASIAPRLGNELFIELQKK